MKLFFILLFILSSISFKPVQSATAYLKCTSESGRTTFTAEIGDIDGVLEKAELTIDNVKLKFNDNDRSYVIFDGPNGVYTIFIESDPSHGADFTKYKFLKFRGIPKTFNAKIDKPGEKYYQFKGKLNATELRKGKDLITPEIELNCTLEYHT